MTDKENCYVGWDCRCAFTEESLVGGKAVKGSEMEELVITSHGTDVSINATQLDAILHFAKHLKRVHVGNSKENEHSVKFLYKGQPNAEQYVPKDV